LELLENSSLIGVKVLNHWVLLRVLIPVEDLSVGLWEHHYLEELSVNLAFLFILAISQNKVLAGFGHVCLTIIGYGFDPFWELSSEHYLHLDEIIYYFVFPIFV